MSQLCWATVFLSTNNNNNNHNNNHNHNHNININHNHNHNHNHNQQPTTNNQQTTIIPPSTFFALPPSPVLGPWPPVGRKPLINTYVFETTYVRPPSCIATTHIFDAHALRLPQCTNVPPRVPSGLLLKRQSYAFGFATSCFCLCMPWLLKAHHLNNAVWGRCWCNCL